MPVREDCWSEEATSTLIDAWGRRYMELNRGNLRQKDWQEVADSVNALHGHTKKTHRTDVQCKNRIDTIKKKYKKPSPSLSPSPPVAVPLPLPYRKTPSSAPPPRLRPSWCFRRSGLRRLLLGTKVFRRNYSAMAAAAAAAEAEEEDDLENEEEVEEEEVERERRTRVGKEERDEEIGEGDREVRESV
ncbi:hypothetical protein FNV43_RR07244 [Rhamnella rubrinervis]|uniref:Myb/SANT-like DNA-binding domain-containing protein n=1 Tax=Rhamnella rubrinervis TaxID=2594499 RepID=A0A8K0HG85_9ROSA|nr:hypothetical protein FNV43_RR07244 [Rhamnella rubrinervis]